MSWGTKNVPNKKGTYLVTAIGPIDGKPFVDIADRYKRCDGTYGWCLHSGGFGVKVIAWRKLDKPYEGAVE